MTFEALDPGRSFRESSRTLSQRRWIHERTIEPAEGGCRVTDRITFAPKIPGAGVVLAPLLHLVFANRHRNLTRQFGGEAGSIATG